MINALCFAGMILRYLVRRAIFSIVEGMVGRVGNGVNSRNPMSERYPFTEKAIIA